MLLARAQEALQSHAPQQHIQADSDILAAAYERCREITRYHSRTFFMASSLLPTGKREAVWALYAFCRITDDIVDAGGAIEGRQAALERWRQVAMDPHPPAGSPVALAWADARARFNIPSGYAEQLIDGVARDLSQDRYETFTDLADYSYGVASTVGLMAMHIIGFESMEALPYAVRLGVALQLTNILRDVVQDWRNGRLYLPLEELHAFGISEADIDAHNLNGPWREFMRYQIDRTRQLYTESWPGIAMLDRDGRFAIAAAAELYRAILQDIENHDMDVFSRRSHVTTVGKVRRLPGIWYRSRQRNR